MSPKAIVRVVKTGAAKETFRVHASGEEDALGRKIPDKRLLCEHRWTVR